jgi:hypothetical protein
MIPGNNGSILNIFKEEADNGTGLGKVDKT